MAGSSAQIKPLNTIAGQAVKFQADMEKLITLAARDIRNAFESVDYAATVKLSIS